MTTERPCLPARWRRALGLALLTIAGAALGYALFLSPDVAFLRRAGGAPWITSPLRVDSNLIGVDLASIPSFVFVKRFGVETPGAALRLEVRALRHFELELNGVALPTAGEAQNWRRFFRLEVGDRVLTGRNELRVRVRNPRGPPLLQLRLEGPEQRIDTDESWQVIAPGANPAPARIADDTRPHPDSLLLPEPGQILRQRAIPLALLFAACALLYAAARSFASASSAPVRAHWMLALVTLFWGLFFVLKLSHMPVLMGFDAPAHLLYLDFIAQHGTLPLASDGFSSYHPPAFYLLTSLFIWLFDASRAGVSGPIVYRLVAFLAGLANVWLSYFVARAIWRHEQRKVALAVAVAGLLPMNLYMSAYVSNETLHAAWVSLALWLTAHLMLHAGAKPATLLALGGVLGLGLLTKFTSLAIAPIVVLFVACKLRLADSESMGRVLMRGGAVVATLLVTAGWFYARNWLVFGDPVVWNLDIPGAPVWWMQPGFHTASYYTHFGEALRHPFFAGFHSFWDGVYSTLWGDGLVAGMRSVATRHAFWNYEFMSLCYWLAFPASILFGLGFWRLARHSLEGSGRRAGYISLLVCLLFVLAFSLLLISLRLPFYAQPKAFYVLSAVVPLALIGAEGLDAPLQALRGVRAALFWQSLYVGWLGSLGGAIAMAFLA